jgi:replication factor A1
MAELISKLSQGTIPAVFHDKYKAEYGPLRFQILAVKILSEDQVRLKVSDGIVETGNAMYNGSAKPEGLESYAMIEIQKHELGNLKNKKIIFISQYKLIHTANETGGKKMGNPKAWKFEDIGAPPAGSKYLGNTYSGNKENTKPKPYSTGLTSGERYIAIQTLTPYMNKWTIKGRVTQKGDMKTWNNARGSGNLFSFTIVDESCDLKVTAFKEDADKFFPVIEKGKCYTISNGQLKAKNSTYNNTQQDYELTLGKATKLEPAGDVDLPTQLYDFMNFAQIEKLELVGERPRKTIDICAIVKEADESFSQITIKAQNKELSKREITLCDDTGKTIKATLWGDMAEGFDMSKVGSCIAVKAASLGSFNGKSISIGGQSDVNFDLHEDPRSGELMKWWANNGTAQNFTALSSSQGGGARADNWKRLADVNAADLIGSDPVYFTSKGTITYVAKENIAYKACMGKNGEKCQKKVLDEGNGNYRCEKCDITQPGFNYRIILKAMIADDTGGHYTTFFGLQGEQILNVTSEEFGEILEKKDEGGERDFEKVVNGPLFAEYIFNSRAVQETYQDEAKVRMSTNRIADINYVDHANRLFKQIEEYSK